MEDAPLSRDRAKYQLARCLEEGAVIYTRHFRDELANDNLTTQDVLVVCKAGVIVMAPERDIRTGQWKYGIEGITVGRREIAVVFCSRATWLS